MTKRVRQTESEKDLERDLYRRTGRGREMDLRENRDEEYCIFVSLQF